MLLLIVLFVHTQARPYKKKRAQSAAAVSFVILIILAVSNCRFAVTLVDMSDHDSFESVVRGFRFAFLFFPLLALWMLQLWKRRAGVAEAIRAALQRISKFSQELVVRSPTRRQRDPVERECDALTDRVTDPEVEQGGGGSGRRR